MNIPNCYYRVSIKALILDEQRRFLLIKEENGMWELPGGGLDFGEDIHEAMKRELKEEMGLESTHIATNPSYFITAKHDDKEAWYANVMYEVSVKNLDFVPSEECLEIRYFTVNEAVKVPMYAKGKEFIKQYDPKNHNI